MMLSGLIPSFAVNSAVNGENRGNGASMKRGLEPDEGTCRGVEGSKFLHRHLSKFAKRLRPQKKRLEAYFYCGPIGSNVATDKVLLHFA